MKKKCYKSIKFYWLIIYIFIAIFQPPILPIPLIYITGLLTIFLLMFKFNNTSFYDVFRLSGLSALIKLMIFMLIYLIAISLIDVFIDQYELFENRIRCINQLLVLQVIQILEIIYILLLSKELRLNLKNVIVLLVFAGFLQGLCSFFAYMSPGIRHLFTLFADETLFTNQYFVERRGYGFSSTLIDTFGYGMGLLCGYLILSKLSKKFVVKVFCAIMIVFSILFNARTGFIIIFIAIAIKFFQSKSLAGLLIKALIAIPAFYLIVFRFVPEMLSIAGNSTNVTIQWVTQDLKSLYETIIFGKNNGTSLQDVSFLSSFTNLPTNIVSILFGTGHSAYGSYEILGFHSDVGYVNLIWEFGLFGTAVFLICIFVWLIKPFFKTKNVYIRSFVLLNVFSYFVVLLKAILIGYNPGVFITYFVTAAIYYSTKSKKEYYDSMCFCESINCNASLINAS